jgi:enoyl-[acyl-carrier protein] reductase I
VSFLGLEGKTFLVMGAANRRSVATHAGRVLAAEGATVLHSVQSEERRSTVAKLVGDAPIFTCDVAVPGSIESLVRQVEANHPQLDGILHSIAFARYPEGEAVAFEVVSQANFLESMHVSCYSLLEVAHHFRPLLVSGASVVTVSISTTNMAAENYGYMAPVKAALESSVVFLAKSFARQGVRFNAVCAGLLKTSASAGIPGYVDSYLFAEKVTPRKTALTTEEVANTIAFLLSARSSGINAQRVVVDAGMGCNYFDRDIVTPPRPGGTG